jgi:bifunctional UDP-N-acetylglucosamine pyrophosphorylase / glucosamine-1-phosphate N-acetyltransferase
MKAIIMAGGKGTRLKSQLPKVLHPLMDKPLLAHVLDALARMDTPPDEAIIITGHEATQVEQAVHAHHKAAALPFGVRCVRQSPQLGTGHAVQQVLNVLPANVDCRVLIVSGDVPLVRPLTLQQLAAQTDDVTLAAATIANPTGYGRVMGLQAGGYTIVEEKDCPEQLKHVNMVNVGMYQAHWPKLAGLLAQLTNENAQQEYYLTDCIRLASEQQMQVGVVALVDASEMIGVNSRHDLAECHQLLNQRTIRHWLQQGVTIIDPNSTWIGPDVTLAPDVTVYPHCWLTGAVTVEAGATLGPACTLTGPVTIGAQTTVTRSVVSHSTIAAHCTVGPFAHIRGNTHIAEDVRIGNFVEVKNATVASQTNAAHLAYVGDATVGQHVNIGAGTITANYDPIRGIKSHTVVGDGVKIGSNSVLVAPVHVGQNACVAAGSVITQDVEPGSLAIARQRQRDIAGWVERTQGQTPLQAAEPI